MINVKLANQNITNVSCIHLIKVPNPYEEGTIRNKICLI